MIPFPETAPGSACVLFVKNRLDPTLQRVLTGFAAGIMTAASVWSLLIPAMEQSESMGRPAFISAAAGFWIGILFLLLLDKTIPHLHMNSSKAEGSKISLRKTTMLVLAVTLHNLPEGMAVGVVYAGMLSGAVEPIVAEVAEAAEKACCADFIEALPNGYDTVIGEGGASLSGGEKQRISIARAMLKDAPVIILDEAAANVDPENGDRLRKAIEELTRDKTIIMIAHRLKTVHNADQILAVDNGRIVQRGSYDELIGQDGIYAGFVPGRRAAVSRKL